MKKPYLSLVRGPAGSGKTTFALKNFFQCVLVEADIFRYDENCKYQYDPATNQHAHSQCLRSTEALLSVGTNVVVANTFIKKWELQPYIDLCQKLNLDPPHIYIPDTPWAMNAAECHERNTHDVPLEVIERMIRNFDFII